MNRKKTVSPDGSVYQGDWLDGKRSGYGSWSRADGTRYVGYWEDDKPSGEGIILFADGTTYSGSWKEGKRDGQGTLTYPDGRKLTGLWSANQFVEEQGELEPEQVKPSDQPSTEPEPEPETEPSSEPDPSPESETEPSSEPDPSPGSEPESQPEPQTEPRPDHQSELKPEKSAIFRKASLESISSPDQLNEYIRVSTPSVWIVLVAMFALLSAVLVWGFTGSLPTTTDAQGVVLEGRAVCFLSPAEIGDVRVGQEAVLTVVGGDKYAGRVSSVSETPKSLAEIATEVQSDYLVEALVEGEFALVVTVEIEGPPPADKTLLAVSIVTESVRPIDFLWR